MTVGALENKIRVAMKDGKCGRLLHQLTVETLDHRLYRLLN